MSKIPEQKTDYAREFPAYTQPADHLTSVLPALIEGLCEVIQSELENPLASLIVTNSVDQSSDQLLDYWGELVDESRDGRDNEPYRTAIRAKIRRNLSNGTWSDLIAIARSLYGDAALDIDVSDSPPAEGVMEVRTDASLLDADQIFALLDNARAAGVRLHYIHWPDDEENLFTFSDTGSLTTGDTSKGFANDAQTTGGKLVSALAAG